MDGHGPSYVGLVGDVPLPHNAGLNRRCDARAAARLAGRADKSCAALRADTRIPTDALNVDIYRMR